MPVNPDELLHEPYWSLTDIVEFATHRKFNDVGSDPNTLFEFKSSLLDNLRNAILNRMIVPVDVLKQNHWYQKYKQFIDLPLKLIFPLIFLLLLYMIQLWINAHPEYFKNYFKARN